MAHTLYELCCFLCCPPWPSKIAAKIAFQPPPPTYCISYERDRCHFILLESSVNFSEYDKSRIECLFATTSRGNRIACLYVRNKNRSKYTILFSHGNASDLGQMCQFFYSLATLTGCDIFGYDYSGYGASSGRPSEKNMYADIDCAWQTLQSSYGVPPDRIILYGMSLGTVPSVDLAARRIVGAVILHSPLTSAIRVLLPNTKRTWCWDAFTSIEKVPNITSPVLVIHGTEDRIIPFSHGVAIYEKCQRGVRPLWIGGAGHDDIEGCTQYLERLRKFVYVELDNSFDEDTVVSERCNSDKTTSIQNRLEEGNQSRYDDIQDTSKTIFSSDIFSWNTSDEESAKDKGLDKP